MAVAKRPRLAPHGPVEEEAAVSAGVGEPDVLWLHAWTYTCECARCAFSIEAPPPEWAAEFGPLHELLGAMPGKAAPAVGLAGLTVAPTEADAAG